MIASSGGARQGEVPPGPPFFPEDALACLSAADRELIALRNLQGLDWTEVARRTRLTPAQARRQWGRALRILGTLLEGSA